MIANCRQQKILELEKGNEFVCYRQHQEMLEINKEINPLFS